MAIRIGIYGYGNLGKGVEAAIRQNSDMTLAAVFTRRDPPRSKQERARPFTTLTQQRICRMTLTC